MMVMAISKPFGLMFIVGIPVFLVSAFCLIGFADDTAMSSCRSHCSSSVFV
jgi:hypothetical protein